MKIKDITLDDIRSGKNWRVLEPDILLQDEFALEELDIESLGSYSANDTLVYSGISVHLMGAGEPKTSLLDRVLGRKRYRDCCYPPDDPKNLKPNDAPIVRPLVMVKEVQESGWDYCVHVNGIWRQLGLSPNPNTPLVHEYFANPVPEDPEFDIPSDDITLRQHHIRGFHAWIPFLNENTADA